MCISLLDPKMDFIFKKIFGSENDKSILISFLNVNFTLDDAFEIHFLELPKLKIYDVKDPLTGWGMFLKEPSSNMVEDAEDSIREIKNAKKKLYIISADEDERERYRMREKGRLDAQSAIAEAVEKGIERGIEQGIERGKKEAKLQLAKSLRGLLPDEVIGEKTGLSLEEILNII
ncbi:MAG: Rpn family recombination-promoting nuclease/putative transposase [Fusobacteriaceae bacterium]